METFLPPYEKNDIHLIISKDKNGLNAGVFFLRVNSWSLNYMMRTSAYAYYHKTSFLFYSDQASMNNVLIDESPNEDEHFIVVPQYWFNMYINEARRGQLLIHMAGVLEKDSRSRDLRKIFDNEPSFYQLTSEELRKEVLLFYEFTSNKTLTNSS